MSSKEFAEWVQYEKIRPVDAVMADLRTALICKTLADINRGKNTPAFSLEDFILKFEDTAVTTQNEKRKEVQAKMKMWKNIHSSAQVHSRGGSHGN